MQHPRIDLDRNAKLSLQRPAYTAGDLYAFRHRHVMIRNRFTVIKDFFVKSKGLIN